MSLAAASSATVKSGAIPKSSAWARNMRAQAPWMVEIQAESTRSAWSDRPQALSAPFTRDLISPAAFEVNVIASTSSMPETNPHSSE